MQCPCHLIGPPCVYPLPSSGPVGDVYGCTGDPSRYRSGVMMWILRAMMWILRASSRYHSGATGIRASSTCVCP
eukprot:7612657-Pyramimonas_sp.AAC.2